MSISMFTFLTKIKDSIILNDDERKDFEHFFDLEKNLEHNNSLNLNEYCYKVKELSKQYYQVKSLTQYTFFHKLEEEIANKLINLANKNNYNYDPFYIKWYGEIKLALTLFCQGEKDYNNRNYESASMFFLQSLGILNRYVFYKKEGDNFINSLQEKYRNSASEHLSKLKNSVNQKENNKRNLNNELNSINNNINNIQIMINTKKMLIKNRNQDIISLNNLATSLNTNMNKINIETEKDINVGKNQVQNVENNIKDKKDFMRELSDLEKNKEKEIEQMKNNNELLKQKSEQLINILTNLELKLN